MKRPEILAPAGDFTCLQAAIDAGADAVYFGLGTFNMRARSGVNFKIEDLPEIARRCELGSNRVDVESARVGVGSARVRVESARVGVESARVGVGSARVGVGSNGVGVESARVGVESARVGVESDGVGAKLDRVCVGVDRDVSGAGPNDPAGLSKDLTGLHTDPIGLYTDPSRRYTDPTGRYRDPIGLYKDPTGRYRDPIGLYEDPTGRYRDPIRRYLTLNAIMFEGEMEEVEKTIVAAKPYVDAFIVSDWGVISLCKKHGVRFHVSTQMSTSNSEAVRFLASQGAERVVLARECTLAEVSAIVEKLKGLKVEELKSSKVEKCDNGALQPFNSSTSQLPEIECFVHGAQCVAESGRCFMSHDVFGKSACRGECKQPCRRRFLVKAVDLYEDDEGNPVHESDTAFLVEPHTVLSAKDLCSLGFVDKLMAAGIASFKIEGRARNANYVKAVVTAYRRAVDAVMDGTYTPALVAELTDLVKTVFHREFADGMYFGRPGVDQFTDSEDSMATTVKRHIGIVIDYFLKAGIAQVKVQDHSIATGDAIQIHGPTTGVLELTAGELRRDELIVQKCEKGDWITLKTPRCRVGDKVFFVELR